MQDQMPSYLIRKPNVLGALLSIFEFLGIIIMISEEEYHAVDWPPEMIVSWDSPKKDGRLTEQRRDTPHLVQRPLEP